MKSERFEKGTEMLEKLTGGESDHVIENIMSFAPDFGKMIIEFGFGEIYGRETFDVKQRSIITLTSLISQGAGERQLTFHFKAGLHAGLTKEEIIEIIIHCAGYAGFPKAANALEIFKTIVEAK
ncbi:carboxymuconolactone decarboxylase family protein [Bacillus sp. 31A1R]|uniref:Carboxymuconolactone decarboxylase family protein n=1 Tax=Robertmurraya mangrovi TaxID=3098077 RepID=A0ABU5IYI0_9BACI|nr:carboxymuconolactone decarboxylase family protein [Bacillus sp. 31A1R]MDZ5472202.1 carboxymuconolactone decarboxylase family protein [Bacillus sp. 31A1R]